MCVIIYKKRGLNIPDRQFLLKCWIANPDGGGFAYNDNNAVHYQKGFQKFSDFYNTLLKVNEESKLYNKDLIIHFRIGTSGGKTPQKTHPFVITNSYRKMEKLQGTCKQSFFHNGIMSDFASDKHSDTENFTAMILSTIRNLEQQDTLIDYLARVNNSKFAIITRNRVILGGDYLSDNNMLVSNRNYSYYYNTQYNDFDKTKYSYISKSKSYLYDDYNYYNNQCGFDIYD